MSDFRTSAPIFALKPEILFMTLFETKKINSGTSVPFADSQRISDFVNKLNYFDSFRYLKISVFYNLYNLC